MRLAKFAGEAGVAEESDDLKWQTMGAQLRALAQHTPLMLFTFDTDGKVVHSEGLGFQVLKRPPGTSPIGQSIYLLYKDTPWVLDAAKRALKGESVRTIGQLGDAWFDGQLLPIRDAGGKIVAVTGLALDITQQRKEQEARVADQSRLRLMLQQLPAIVWTTDRDLVVTSSVGAGKASLPLADHENIGHAIEDILPKGGMDPVAIEDSRRALAGERVETTARFYGRELMSVIEPLKNAAGEIIGTIGLSFDVTEHRAAERERDRLYEEAQRAVQLRDEFLAVASHELNTPLMSLLLGVEKLRSTTQGRIMDIVHRQTHRLVQLVHGLLDVSRLAAGRLELHCENVDLAAIARDIVDRHAIDAQESGCQINVAATTPILGTWDRSRVEQVITNLLSNAIKFGAKKPIEVTVDKTATHAILVVRDHGIGIDVADQPTLFQRFRRAAPLHQYGGLGLGLYITRRLVEAHGGTVAVSGAAGKGATFTVELPLTPPAP